MTQGEVMRACLARCQEKRGAPEKDETTTLADARILTRTLPNAPQNYVFITRNREVSENQEAEFTIYGLEELILAVETVC